MAVRRATALRRSQSLNAEPHEPAFHAFAELLAKLIAPQAPTARYT